MLFDYFSFSSFEIFNTFTFFFFFFGRREDIIILSFLYLTFLTGHGFFNGEVFSISRILWGKGRWGVFV